MKRKNILLLILVLCIIPSIANALTEEEAIQNAETALDRLPVIENDNGSCTWQVKSIDFEILQANTCNYTKETIVEVYPLWAELSDDELESRLLDHNNSCRNNVTSLMFDNLSERSGNNRGDIYVGHGDYVDDQVTVRAYYEYEDGGNTLSGEITKTCSISFEPSNENLINKAQKVTQEFDYHYSIHGLNSFNSVYHYGPLFDNAFDDNLMLFRFPKFKKVIMDNPEFDYKIAWEGAGGTPNMSGSAGYVTLYKNDVAYAMKYVHFTLYNEFYVDKNAEGTQVEKAEARLREYFGENVVVEIDQEKVDYFDEEWIKGYYTNVTIGEHQSPIFIIEVEENDLDKYNVEAYHKETGVGVDSDSYEVPVDATLDVKDVKDEEYVQKAFSNGMLNLTDAYDISVVKTANGAIVDVIENGIDVYIPVEKRKVGQKVNVHHITEDGKLGDKYQAVVIEKDGKLYAHFTTTHFSTYAVSDVVSTNVTNPETFDNITNSLLVSMVAVVSLITVAVIFTKKNKDILQK